MDFVDDYYEYSHPSSMAFGYTTVEGFLDFVIILKNQNEANEFKG